MHDCICASLSPGHKGRSSPPAIGAKRRIESTGKAERELKEDVSLPHDRILKDIGSHRKTLKDMKQDKLQTEVPRASGNLVPKRHLARSLLPSGQRGVRGPSAVKDPQS